MRPAARRVALGFAAFAFCGGLALHGVGAGWFGADERAGSVSPEVIPRALIEERAAAQRASAPGWRADDASSEKRTSAPKQILFGDLHVHSTFSFDAFLLGLPMLGGMGSHPPADACDFARHCSALDFWSINDHAEYLTERLWNETIESVRQCNAVAGDARDPDLVTYLGWEWSQIGTTPENHYGHKNVVLRGTDDDAIPTRPIAATSPGFVSEGGPIPASAVTALALLNGERGRSFARFLAQSADAPRCPSGVSVRELPSDCREYAPTPADLFAKLDDWALPSIVIPHGTTWGIYTPPLASWEKQLATHDPERQRLVEVYSGHGNSEEYRDWRPTVLDADRHMRCPEPTADYLPSCWRSGELIRARCLEEGESPDECERRTVTARQHYVDAYNGGWLTAPGQNADAWLDSGQCRDCFQPSFNYRPTSSAQYMLAVRNFDEPGEPKRFRFGFIGSSDIHTAKPGSGYKEFWRGEMTEGRGMDPGRKPPAFMIPDPGEPAAESTPYDLAGREARGMSLFENERANSFFTTGGLVAVHSPARDRDSIFGALERSEVYGTSGPRILLWFDLLKPDESVLPMGGSTRQNADPRFRVRAVGSFEQKPGCPESSTASLGPERTQMLCGGECYHPSEVRRPISRIEVVRIRPQNSADEAVGPLVEDPWLRHECAGEASGCEFEFHDPEFASSERDAVYYVRAIEAPSLAIHGSNPLGCEYDETGRCISVEPCGVNVPSSDDCLTPTEQRAWSSPIFVDFAARD